MFAYQVSVVVCGACRGLVRGAPSGGDVPCPSCGASAAFPDRAARLGPPCASTPGAQDPSLRSQDGRPLLPPPSIAFLWDGTDLPAHRLDEARAAWEDARRRAGAGEVGAGEELVFLTRELASKAQRGGDLERARALYESALLAAPLPRQRTVVLGALTRAAVRAGEAGEALQWWGHLEGGPDLESDSEWRVSTAVVLTANGDLRGALAAVGERHDEVAIEDAIEAQAGLFRANALEKLGRLEDAKAELLRLLRSGGPPMLDALEGSAALYGPLALCATSLPAVVGARHAEASAAAGRLDVLVGGILVLVGAGGVILPMGGACAMPVVSGVGMLVAEGVPRSTREWGALLGALGAETAAAVGVALLIAVPMLIPLGIGVGMVRAGLRERRTFQWGVRALARVVEARPTGTEINDQPELELTLDVRLDPPVRSTMRVVVPVTQIAAVGVGREIYVRIDPSDPTTAVLDR